MFARASIALAALALASAVVSCRAPDEVRRGAVGEWCNGSDDDCRLGLVCERGVCADPGGGPRYSCAEICEHLTSCEAGSETCVDDCKITIEDWAERAVSDFGICLVEDLSCADARADFAPQTCYERIPIPEDRATSCAAFVEAAKDCNAAQTVRNNCRQLARVGRQDAWDEASAACQQAVDASDCDGIRTCADVPLSGVAD